MIIRAGTSGWSYDERKGSFYPETLESFGSAAPDTRRCTRPGPRPARRAPRPVSSRDRHRRT